MGCIEDSSFLLLRTGCNDGFRTPQAIHGGRENAACVPGALTGWKKAAYGCLAAFVPQDANRRGASGLRTGQYGIRVIEAGELSA